MRPDEALKILGVGPGATPKEVKEAYRDLVKVWHPDRFGSDPRLRQKAEEKLKEINDAYGLLQSGLVSNGSAAAEAENTAGASGSDASSSYKTAAPTVRKNPAKRHKNARMLGWVFGGSGIVLGLVAGYLLRERGATDGVRETPVVVQQGEMTHPIDPAGPPDRKPAPKDAGGSNRSDAAQYRIFSLSDAQTSQLESACLSQRKLHGEVGYQACVQAQLNSITNTSTPDLSALSVGERESIDSVCSGAKRRGGPNSYNRCLNVQIAQLAAEPLRPDLSTLSVSDRNAIEAACRSPKYREGPSSYDRCLTRFIKLLAESE